MNINELNKSICVISKSCGIHDTCVNNRGVTTTLFGSSKSEVRITILMDWDYYESR